jgi:hypothetical protein
MRFQVLRAVSMKMAAFWVVAPFCLVEVYRRFRDAVSVITPVSSSTSETSVNVNQTTQCKDPEDAIFSSRVILLSCICSAQTRLVIHNRLKGVTELVDLEEFLQPNSVLDDEITTKGRRNSTNRCYRMCTAGAEPMTCYFRWTIEDYNTLGP